MTYTDQDLAAAIETARSHFPVDRMVTRPEFLCDYVIVDRGKWLSILAESAWTRPAQRGVLPWSPPTGTIVGFVSHTTGQFRPA